MDTVRVRMWMNQGCRPAGRMGAKLFTITKSAIELRLEFKEGQNHRRDYGVSPVRVDCDREYPDYVAMRARLDSMKTEMARLSRMMGRLGPDLKLDSGL